MQKRKYIIKRIIILQMIFISILTMVFNMCISTKSMAYTVTHNQSYKSGINQFPESYREKLQALKNNHSNWNFTAFYTGITWSEFISHETGTHLRNTVHSSSPAAWKDGCNRVASGYACASSPIVAYYADPRNFLTEDRNISIYGNVI